MCGHIPNGSLITDLYCELPRTAQNKLKTAATPCLPESSVTDAHVLTEGRLHEFAARILMRPLWLFKVSSARHQLRCGRDSALEGTGKVARTKG